MKRVIVGVLTTALKDGNDQASRADQHGALAACVSAFSAIDANGDGLISGRNEIAFTDWDATATSDLEANRTVFDTNNNGLLDAGDARWSSFRIVVTNADGTTSVKTLSELGIQSISLTADKTETVLPDGSRITGQATFTRTNGTTGTVADASLNFDAQGRALAQTVDTATCLRRYRRANLRLQRQRSLRSRSADAVKLGRAEAEQLNA